MSLVRVNPNYSLRGHVSYSRNYAPLPLRLANADSRVDESPRRIVKVIPSKMLSSVLITLGAITLLISVIYSSSILALIGLGLLFFGIIFTYFSSDEYVKKILLDTTVSSQQATLKDIIQKLRYKGDIVYLPPKYLRNPEVSEVFVSKRRDGRLPKLEQLQSDAQDFSIDNLPGLLFTPPGAELSKLFEKALGTNFISVDLQYLRQNMPKLFIEDLEIAQDFEIDVEGNRVRVEIQDSVYSASDIESEESSSVNSTLGSPLSSAIACALAKATNKPVVIEKQQTSKNGKDVTIDYLLIEDEEEK
jgi:hypothetical protein